jgi:hypothetical protein
VLLAPFLVHRIRDHDKVGLSNKSTVAQKKPPNSKVVISAKIMFLAEHVARYRTQVEARGIFDADKIHTYRWSKHLMFLDELKHSSKVGGGYWF